MPPTHRRQFVQVLFSLEVYLLSPFARRYICRASCLAHVAATLALLGGALLLLLPLSRPAASCGSGCGLLPLPLPLPALLLAAVVFVSLVCPYGLVRIHKFKAKINGPWDEAVPHMAPPLPRSMSRGTRWCRTWPPPLPTSTGCGMRRRGVRT